MRGWERSTAEEGSLADAQVPDFCHHVAGGAISRTSQYGPWSRFGEGAGEFKFGAQVLGDPRAHCLVGGCHLVYAAVLASGHGSAFAGALVVVVGWFLVSQQAVSFT